MLGCYCAEDAQRICVAAYPLMKTWLQQITLPRPEMFQPLCFFIAMSVGNNCEYSQTEEPETDQQGTQRGKINRVTTNYSCLSSLYSREFLCLWLSGNSHSHTGPLSCRCREEPAVLSDLRHHHQDSVFLPHRQW